MPHQADGAESSGDLSNHFLEGSRRFSSGMDKRTHQREGPLERYHLGGRRNKTTMFHAFRKSRARDERMHDLIKSLFWLQVDSEFTLKLK